MIHLQGLEKIYTYSLIIDANYFPNIYVVIDPVNDLKIGKHCCSSSYIMQMIFLYIG